MEMDTIVKSLYQIYSAKNTQKDTHKTLKAFYLNSKHQQSQKSEEFLKSDEGFCLTR